MLNSLDWFCKFLVDFQDLARIRFGKKLSAISFEQSVVSLQLSVPTPPPTKTPLIPLYQEKDSGGNYSIRAGRESCQ